MLPSAAFTKRTTRNVFIGFQGVSRSCPLKIFQEQAAPPVRFLSGGRILKKAGLADGAAPPAVLEKEWFARKNPNGEYLRMIAKKP
jgi:hypothetical protein